MDIAAITSVAPCHVLADCHWTMEFGAHRPGPITSTSAITYLVKLDEPPKILAYVSHEDQEKVMRRDGLM